MVFRVSGESTSNQGSGALAEGTDEEAVMECFIEEVANYEPSNCGATTQTREVQVNHS